MRKKTNKHLGIEIEPDLHYKLHYIAKYEGRSANGQILYLLRQCIRAFEQENGSIEPVASGVTAQQIALHNETF